MNNKNYTAEELDLIRKCYSSQGAEWLARELGRSASAIRCTASRMGLRSSFRRRPRKQQPLQPSAAQQPLQPSEQQPLQPSAAQQPPAQQPKRKCGRPRKQQQPEVREVERPRDPARHIKTDNMSNYDPEGVLRAQQAEAAASAGKVMLRINERTHILVPRHLATPEYAEQVRRRWNGNRTSHHG